MLLRPRAVVPVAALVFASVAAQTLGDAPVSQAWPPAVRETGRESPPLSPDAALKTFHLPPGYRLELVASEPLVQDPVVIDWDPDGRLWVVEMPGYMRTIAAADEHAPIGRVVVLEDSDGDGRMDRRTVFADGLVMPRALKVLDRGVLVGEPPNIWLMRDTDGDLRADTRTLVTDRYGRREIDPQNNANALFWAIDNRTYTTGQSDIILRPSRDAREPREARDGRDAGDVRDARDGRGARYARDGRNVRDIGARADTRAAPNARDAGGARDARDQGGARGTRGTRDMSDAPGTLAAFDVLATPRRGQWGVTQDDAGRIYRNSNESALHVDLVPTIYFARNPAQPRTRGSYERLADDNPDLNVVWPARTTPAANRAYQSGILREDGSLARFTAVCAPLVYRGDRLPADVHGNVFVAEPAGNVVSRIILSDDGARLQARKAYARGEFIASTDERFRPVYLSNAPDGTLYVVDMYRGILEHRLSMTEYLRDQIVARGLERPIGMGRIYRVVHETTRRDPSRALAAASPAELVAALAHPNGWWRDTAQRLLVERRQAMAGTPTTAGAPTTAALTRMADSADDWRARLHALWTLDGIGAATPAIVTRALKDPSREVRAAGIRVAEQWLGETSHPLQAAVIERRHDADASVRRQLAASLGILPVAVRVVAVTSLLNEHGDDPITMDAAISGLRGIETIVLEKLMQTQQTLHTPQREAAIVMLAATIVRGADAAAAQRLFAWIGDDERPAWQRAAVLRGAEVALLGAAMPGTPVARTGSASGTPAPCPTCPGGRGGPGGAYAYPRPVIAPAAAAAGPGSGAPLRLNAEPRALTGFPPSDPLAARVTSLLARLSWPGKSGDIAPAAPLTMDEQRRFDAGREVYATICQACHQPDGRGQDKLAPSLIGSAMTLGPSDITARILLQGKEGGVGLMPPVGGVLTDAQLADVLTYVRRAWGQSAAPVDAATVATVRARTKERTRPWTDDELRKLAAGANR